MTLKDTAKIACVALALLVVGLLAGSQAYSITDEEIFRDFRFNFINPGARSLAMGGAFVAIADDSTAALANPAGLVWLTKPELFEEFRLQTVHATETSNEITDPNSTLLGITGTVSSSTVPKNVFSPSFFSYVYPAGKWAVGISRQELVNVNNRTSSVSKLSLFGGLTFAGTGSIETEISNWNLSGAYKITDNLSVGATLVYSILSLDSRVDNTFIDPSGLLAGLDPNSPTFDPNTPFPFYTTKIHDTDSDLAYNLGISWNIGKHVTVAGSYRKGPRFLVKSQIGPQYFNNGGGFWNPQIDDPNVIGPSTDVTFHVPDSYRVGVAYRPIDRLTVSLEGTRIEYSDLMDGFTSGMNILTFKDCNQDQCAPGSYDSGAHFVADDRTEVHLGGEYVFTVGTNPLAVRVGGYTDPDNRVRADFREHKLSTLGFTTTLADGQGILSNNDSFPARDDEVHVTVGAGMVIQERFQIDVALDFSDIADQYVLSSIYRF